MKAEYSQSERPIWERFPTNEEVLTAYRTPLAPENLEKFQAVVPYTSMMREEQSGFSFDTTLIWPDEETEKHDSQIFCEITKLIISSLRMDDATYNEIVLPVIELLFQQTFIYAKLFAKESISGEKKVIGHIVKVTQLMDTTKCTVRERFILRNAAPFHDLAKIFGVGSDQLHLHAYLSSIIFKKYMLVHQDELLVYLHQIETENNGATDFAKLEIRYKEAVKQTEELIRLHHILEQVDKGRLALDEIVAIFIETKLDLFLLGLFVIADGGSGMDEDPKKRVFTINNLNILSHAIDLINKVDYLENEKETNEVKLSFVQALQWLIATISVSTQNLSEHIKQIVEELRETLDEILVRALLGLEVELFVPESANLSKTSSLFPANSVV